MTAPLEPLQTDALVVRLYDELRQLAEAKLAKMPVGQTLQPTDLLHEMWARLRGDGDPGSWSSQGHFFAAAAQAMRNVLVDRLRARRRHKRGGELRRTTLPEDTAFDAGLDDESVLAVHEALDGLAVVSSEAARVAVMRYFGGLAVDEIARSLALSISTIERHWRFARAWLKSRLEGDDVSAAPR